MTDESYAEALDLSEYDYEGLVDKLQEREYEGTEYRYVPDYNTKVERGTVLIDGDVVRGFPKVPRTLVLSEGVPRYFDDEVVVEEKMNGYNTRVARVDGEKLAFSRSGIVCPFTTRFLDRVYGDELDALLDEHPGAVVCCETVGRDNPYTAHDYEEVDSLDMRVFDVRDARTGESLRVEERRELCEEHGLPSVPYYGKHAVEDAVEAVREAIDELDERRREGVVMKTPDVSQQLKYTTSAANQGDLAFAFSLPFDYGQDFMFRRIIREAFQSHEYDDEEEHEERARSLGESVLGSMVETIECVDEGETVGEKHTVSAKPDEVEALLDHLRSMGLHLVVKEDRRDGDERYVEFVKKTQATNDKTATYLDGHIVRE
ncbi:MAG: RNA ligase [Halobacteriales archaeon]|nr:RNA ligase [Halobacteriales archaeon]